MVINNNNVKLPWCAGERGKPAGRYAVRFGITGAHITANVANLQLDLRIDGQTIKIN